MADIFDQFSLLLRERLGPAQRNLMLPNDDPRWNVIDTMPAEMEAGRADPVAGDYPAQYMAKFDIQVQMGGRVAGGRFTGNTPTMMGKDSHLAMGLAFNNYNLDPALTPLDSWIQIAMLLKKIRGSIVVDHGQLEARMMTTPIADMATDAVKAAVTKSRQYIVNSSYSDGTGKMAQINNAAGYTIVETAGGTEIVIDQGTFGRFRIGDLIQAGTNANPYVLRTGGGVSGATGLMRVVDLNGVGRRLRLQSMPGVGSIVLSDNDVLVLYETYEFGGANHAANALAPNGSESLLLDAGVLPGTVTVRFPTGLNVSDYSMLRAFVTDTSATPDDPTMEAFTEILDNMKNAGKELPSAWFAEEGIWTKWNQLDLANNAIVQAPMGQTYMAAGGTAGPVLTHQESRFTKFSSVCVRENTVEGINPSTWRKFVPMGDRTVQWFYGRGPLSGIQSIFGPILSGTRSVRGAEAPFDMYFELGCMDPQANFRRIGIKTQRD